MSSKDIMTDLYQQVDALRKKDPRMQRVWISAKIRNLSAVLVSEALFENKIEVTPEAIEASGLPTKVNLSAKSIHEIAIADDDWSTHVSLEIALNIVEELQCSYAVKVKKIS